jgi:hypothetical protein
MKKWWYMSLGYKIELALRKVSIILQMLRFYTVKNGIKQCDKMSTTDFLDIRYVWKHTGKI